jgi:ClpP class serine protease
LASACRSVITTESGVSGSIGVVLLHSDISGALDKAGISPTLIFAGKHKTDANAFTPLSKEVTADLQQEVDQFYQMFLDCVAAGRGARLTAAAASATEAKTFVGRDALAAGLVDEIGLFSDLVASLEKNPGATRAATSYSTPISGATKLSDTERYLARMEGASSERARIKAILGLPEADADPSAARQIALEGDMTVAQAKAELAQGGNHGWEAIADKLNKEFAASQPKRAVAPTQERKPTQAGAVDWSEIADRLNAEKGVSRHGL